MKYFRSEELYDHTNLMENTHEETHIIGTKERNIEDNNFEEELFTHEPFDQRNNCIEPMIKARIPSCLISHMSKVDKFNREHIG